KSLMPEGLGTNMTVQDFRDLVRYLMAHPFLTEATVAGPFGAREAPAAPLDPSSTANLKWVRAVVGGPGAIGLPAAKSESVVYVTAEVTAPAPLRTRLQLGAGQAVRAWVNGKPVYEGKPGNGPAAPDQASIDVELRAGVNRLLFQVTY